MTDTTNAKLVSIAHLAEHVGAEVTLRGWLYNKRSSGKLHFLLLRDGTGTVQGVVSKKEVDEATWAAGDACQCIPRTVPAFSFLARLTWRTG